MHVEQGSYDRAFKVLTDSFPRSYAAFALGMPVTGPAAPLDRELPATTRHVDSLLRIAGPPPFALLIEAQTYPDPRLQERLCDYCVQVMRAHDLPVRVVVLFLRQEACPREARAGEIAAWQSSPVGGWSALTLLYRPVRLWELDGRQALASLPPELAPLIALMDHGEAPPEEIIKASLARALDGSGVQRREDVYACTAALAALRFDRTLVRHLLEERMILESPLIQEIVQELVEQQVQERAAQSRAEGELLAAVHIAERIARQRFGSAPADLAERLRLLEHDRREAAIAQLATTPSLDEWLRSLG